MEQLPSLALFLILLIICRFVQLLSAQSFSKGARICFCNYSCKIEAKNIDILHEWGYNVPAIAEINAIASKFELEVAKTQQKG